MPKPKPKKNPYQDQAEALSLTRYGPEVSALKALLLQAQEDRDLSLRQAKTGRQFTVGAVDQAQPQVTKAYQGAAQAVAPAFAQGGGIEATALNARMGEAAALAQTQLANRRVGAIEGEGAARTAAFRNFASDREKIGTRATDLARESGAFTTSTIADLIGADAKAQADINSQNATLEQQERNSQRSAGIDPDTGQPIPGGKLDPKAKPGKPNSGRGWASQTEQAAASDEINSMLTWAKNLSKGGVSRQDAATGLLVGAEPEPLYRTVEIKNSAGVVTGHKQERVLWKDGEEGNEDNSRTGTQKTTDALPKAKSQLLLTAALDMAYDGHLSRRTQKLLHDRGVQLGPLGLVTFGEWLKTPEGQAWQQAQGANKTKQRTRPKSTRSIRDIYG